MEKVENDDKVVSLGEKRYADFEPGPVPTAPDGGIAPGFGMEGPPPVPELNAENCVCLRGPCRYYWRTVSLFDSGNPADTWEKLGMRAPRQHNHVCLLNRGMETDFTDDCIFECNKWDPLLPKDLVQLDARRRAYTESAAAAVEDQPEEEIDEGEIDAGTDDPTEG